MTLLSRQTKQENIIYTVVWLILFLSPVVDLVFNYDTLHSDSDWWRHGLIDSWLMLTTFLVLFLIHNYILAPILIKHKKTKAYILGCVAVIALFQLCHCIHKPSGGPQGPPPVSVSESRSPQPQWRKDHRHPPIDKHDISMFVIAVMMISANLGVKAYFMSEEEKKRLAKLKEQSLKQELDYLRYQINPHFIMNTLNNIHALVDIDPEQAKDSIVDMSKMMRYLLYDSDKHHVTLNNAVIFLKKYINLMKLRYTDQVTVNVDVPEACSDDVVIVPLVFIPFVENAFKHGVSLNRPSTIDIDIEQKDGRLLFHCHNTKSFTKHEYGGVGINNVTKRLELIYGSDYSLNIKDGDQGYDVVLDLPAKGAEEFYNHPDLDGPSAGTDQ